MQIQLVIVVTFLLTTACSSTRPRVVIETPLGDITAVIESEYAPLTSRHFLKNVDNEIYANNRGTFYRVVRPDNQPINPVHIEVIQGGIDRETGDLSTDFVPHENTRDTGIQHRNGTLSMAREEPGSANTEFFICIGAQPELDFGGKRNPDGKGFAAFGKITSGMKIVRQIQKLKDKQQYLENAVPILNIRRKL
jgi:peptidyl-prolyl cis-trans isomerase A (cyclophilin A)